ncbi:MAG: hypothetical protein CVU57_25645, partial [Deltaproteobacteria bacterium HGW-Deltaproteobacteria-15]
MPNGFSKRGILALSLVAFFLAPAAQSGAWQVKDRVSVSSDGSEGNGPSSYPRLSADGRYIVFQSGASNLVPGDTNGSSDIFVHDRQTEATSRVSVSSGGSAGNGGSFLPSISADGRYVAFESNASNLVPGDTNGFCDIFIHDRKKGATTRVSVDSDGSEGNKPSYDPSISADGRYVVFYSVASNLVPGDTNGFPDVFVHEYQTGATTRVSVSSGGSEGNGGSIYESSISADGRYAAFGSGASNLVLGDTNANFDIFVHDRQTGATSRVSVSSGGSEGNDQSVDPSISADGRYVVFYSMASNLFPGDTNADYDIFVHDRQTGATSRVSVSSGGSEGNGDSGYPSISADGRYVVFHSVASNLVSGDTIANYDIFVHDRQTGATSRVSVTSVGSEGNGDSWDPSISADGRYVAFVSDASNLVSGDTNGFEDVFVAFTPDGSFYFIPGK